jgi:hypothetical protein
MRAALRACAALEGLYLDPVYSGKVMAGLIDLVRRGRFARDQSVVFLHTGGTPALFAYVDALIDGEAGAGDLRRSATGASARPDGPLARLRNLGRRIALAPVCFELPAQKEMAACTVC